MFNSAIIDLAIGLTFVFGVAAALSSAVTELISRLIGLRGAYLLTGLRELVDNPGSSVNLATAEADYRKTQDLIRGGAAPPPQEPPPSATSALLGGPILGNQGMAGQISTRKLTLAPPGGAGRPSKITPQGSAGRAWKQRRSLPSYIPARSFAQAVIDLLVPDQAGQTKMDAIEQGIGKLPDSMSTLRTSLQALAMNANHDLSRFRTSVENWYDDHMDRVSGWYKRHVAKITLAIGAVLVVLFNINTLTIARTLYTQSAVNQAVSTVAAKAVNCPSGQTGQACLATLEAQLSAVATAGLPIGWGTVRDCRAPSVTCNWWDKRGIFSRHGNSGWQLVLVLAGFLITIIAIVPGARFWFGLLNKLGTLRASGPKPTTASS